MSTRLKMYLGRKVIDTLQPISKDITLTDIQPLIQIVNKNSKNDKIEFNLSLNSLEKQLGINNANEIMKIQSDDIIQSVVIDKTNIQRNVSFQINKEMFINDVFKNCIIPDIVLHPKKIIVEYSSPNIAKPFHLGHLRSTIIGNFVSNINSFLKNDVTRLNYLGDWGTQFGFVKVGLEELKYTPDDLRKDPLKVLYKAYVHANKLAEKDASYLEKAKLEFSKLENGSEKDLENWKNIMNFTKNELENTYSRLGVHFDEYNYESMYSSKQIHKVLKVLNEKKVLSKDTDGKLFAKVGDRKVSVVKSDGSTLYLTRDIAAAMDRFGRYKFDDMYYVVDNSQTDHFVALKEIIQQMGLDFSEKMHHIKFGRIRGMSTRKGTSVFLKDILNECQSLMVKRQIQSPTTKVPIKNEEISDILGVSCVILNDLKARRQRDYEFNWDQVLQVQGDTGIKLQYTHCRLCSLEKNSGATSATECNPEVFRENEALVLIRELAIFQDVLYKSHRELEACILVTYLFHLCNHINRALKVLQVKGQNPDVARQRLLLFNTAREVLRSGMAILGLQPLQEM